MNRAFGGTSNETELWSGHPSRLIAAMKCGMVGAGLAYIAVAYPEINARIASTATQYYGVPAHYSVSIGPMVMSGILILFLFELLTAILTRYTVTNERLIITNGLLTRRTDEIELYRVIDVVQSATLLQMLFGVGKVTVKSTDQTGTVTLLSIFRSTEVRNAIRTAAENCKQKRIRIFGQ